ncbi:hypothetical protein TH61_03575 [Rufibacter sp. DG15C]|uniref:hypothetical protein n=1 Tax=Rufibacter sp. DG15C TaxID=1379909 RepID=UPI00078DBFA6|nr:hypothetical protein [Rufibacter sp. DG15C]AMM50448.1 hypothetical protein TH61_03575 [Rufibacter sp. DG15C]
MNPYTKIWTKTSATIDFLLENGLSTSLLNLNFLIAGLTASLLSVGEDKVFATFGVAGGLVFLLFQTVLIWLALKFLLPYMYLLIGKMWNGKATFHQMALIVSLAFIPEVIYLTYVLVLFAVSGEIIEVNYLIRLIGWVFTIRILVIGIAKVQGFNYVFALMNLFLPAIILGVLGLLLGVLNN